MTKFSEKKVIKVKLLKVKMSFSNAHRYHITKTALCQQPRSWTSNRRSKNLRGTQTLCLGIL